MAPWRQLLAPVLRVGLLTLVVAYLGGTAALLWFVHGVERPALQHPQLVEVLRASPARVFYVTSWAPFCAPCIEKFPALDALVRQHDALAVVAVCHESLCTEQEVQDRRAGSRIVFVRERGPLTTTMFPTSFIVDRAARVHDSGLADDNTEQGIRYYLAACSRDLSVLLLLPRAVALLVAAGSAS